jgi:hypothetical protein
MAAVPATMRSLVKSVGDFWCGLSLPRLVILPALPPLQVKMQQQILVTPHHATQ